MKSSKKTTSTHSSIAWNILILVSFFLLIYLPAKESFLLKDESAGYLGLLKVLPIGIGYTLGVTLSGSFFAILIGIFVGLGKMSSRKEVRFSASLYTEVLRGMPLLVLLFYLYYALGELIQIPKLMAAILGFGLSYGAYMSDVFRAGIEAIPKEQGEAARSLGMTSKQVMVKIVFPQALRTIIPAIGNQTLGMLKDTSLISVLAISDILRVGNEYVTKHFNYFETYTYIALVYLFLTLLLAKGVNWLESKFTRFTP